MIARVTMFDIDTLRINTEDALELFKRLVVPEAKKLEGYKGMYVIRTPEGKGLIVSFWATKEAAMTGVSSGYYDDQVKKFVTFYRSTPGRDHYEVVYAEPPGGIQG